MPDRELEGRSEMLDAKKSRERQMRMTEQLMRDFELSDSLGQSGLVPFEINQETSSLVFADHQTHFVRCWMRIIIKTNKAGGHLEQLVRFCPGSLAQN